MVISLDRYRRTRSVGLAIPFGERVANARKDQGLTQDQLGERIGYTQKAGVKTMRWGTSKQKNYVTLAVLITIWLVALYFMCEPY